MSDNVVKKPGMFARLGRSLRDMRGEIKKVVWPSKKQIINNTMIVISFCVLAAIVIGGLDILLTTLVDLLLKKL